MPPGTPRRSTGPGVTRGVWWRSRASRSRPRSGPGPARWSSPRAAPRLTIWHSRAIFWARRDADPRRTRILSTAIEHHAVLDALHWLSAHESAKVELLPVDREGTVDLEALRESIASDPDSVALVSVMWANNEVGTLQPLDEIVAVASPYGIPVHSDAVQAVGAVPVDFAASRLAALTVSAHKLGGPQGVGALVMRRDLDAVPLLHGGGQERDVRSGTLNVAGIVGLAAGLTGSVAGRDEFASRVGGLRDRLVQGVLARAEDAQLNGHPERHLPGLAHFTFPGCEGDSLLMLLDERGIECSTGSACSAGVPQPSHVLLAMGRDDVDARSSLRFSLGRTSTDADVEALLEAIGPVVERGRAAGLVSGFATRRRGHDMKVIAAMSGGVDSAVAAARATEQGHDVTGIHLALSRNPQSYRTGARGCCTVEDSLDARRAADVIGIPFYVWDLSDRFHEDVVEDFKGEYLAGRTPNPCLRCNEKIKFEAVLERALALGYDAVATGHYARLATGPDGTIEMHRAADQAKDQSYVLGVLTQAQLAHALFPLGRHPQGRGPGRGRATWPGRRRQAGLPRHLLHLRRRHRRLAAREAGGGGGHLRRARQRRGPRPSPRSLRLHDRTAARPADRHARRRRPPPLRPRHRAGRRSGDRRPPRAAARRPDRGDPPALVRRPARRLDDRHRPAPRPRRGASRHRHRRTATGSSSSWTTRQKASLRARPRSSTTAHASSAPARSARPPLSQAAPGDARDRYRLLSRGPPPPTTARPSGWFSVSCRTCRTCPSCRGAASLPG